MNMDDTKICLNCANCIYIGEGCSICDVDEPVVVLEDFTPTENYWKCAGCDWEDADYDEEEEDE